MKFILDNAADSNRFTGYTDTSVQINDTDITSSLFVTDTGAASDWRPDSIDGLELTDFEEIQALGCDVVLLGTGPDLQFPPQELHAQLLANIRGLEIMATPACCRTFNIIAGEGRSVCAAILI